MEGVTWRILEIRRFGRSLIHFNRIHMIDYQVPPGLTREQFHSLVTELYYELTKHDIDPAASMIIGDRDEVLDAVRRSLASR